MIGAALLLVASAAGAQQASTGTAVSTSAAYSLPVSTLTPRVEYWADEAEYDRSSGTMVLRGHVKLKDPVWNLKTDELHLDLQERTGEAFGFVLIESTDSAVWGDHGTFDLAEHSAELTGVNGGYRPWYVQASTLTVEGGLHTYSDVNFTTCNFVPNPHYYLHSSVLRVKPKKWVSASNVLFFLGPVPVFYLPYFWNSLDTSKDRVSVQLYLGESAYGGGELFTTTHIPIDRSSYGKVYLDEYTKRGVGTGLEYDRSAAALARASVFGYRIEEPGGTERYTVLGNLFQPLGSGFAAQARLQVLSDPLFNNQYFRNNFFPVTPEVRNAFALTHQDKVLTERLSFERVDEQATPTDTQFARQSQTFPRLDLNTAPLKLPFGVTQTFSAFGQHAWTISNGFDQTSIGGTWLASRSILLTRGLTFVPRATVSETYQDQASSATLVSAMPAAVFPSFPYLSAAPSPNLDNVAVTRYGGGGLLRWSTVFGNLNLDYNFLMRSAPNALSADAAAPDRGVDSNHVALTDLWRPNRLAWVRFTSGYDLRTFLAPVPRDERWDPFNLEGNLQPFKKFVITAADQYVVGVGNQSSSVEADYGEVGGNRVGVGFFHSPAQSGQPTYATVPGTPLIPQVGTGQTFLSQTASYGFTPAWRLTGAIRYAMGGGLPFQVYDKLLSVEHLFHDFYTFLQVEDRPGGIALAFKFNLLFNYEKRAAQTKLDAEQEWYPWRSRPGQR